MVRQARLIGVLVAAAFLLLSGGCAKYRVMSLEPLKPEFHPSALSLDGVHVCHQVLDGLACKRYFNKDLRTVGVQPIQVSVANNSNRTLLLDLSRCSVPCMPPDQVAKKAHFNTAGRATGYGVAGIFIWPLLIPAIVDGAGSSKANTQMDHDYESKGLDDLVIHPFDIANGVFFVPVEEMSPNFAIHLVDREAGAILRFAWTDGQPIYAKYEHIGDAALVADVSESDGDRAVTETAAGSTTDDGP